MTGTLHQTDTVLREAASAATRRMPWKARLPLLAAVCGALAAFAMQPGCHQRRDGVRSTGWRPTADEVARAVEEELLIDPAVPFDSVDVEVADGVVSLRGRVDNLLSRERAARIARTVRGVRAVVNRLEVEPAPPVADPVVAREVRQALAIDPLTAGRLFEVQVDRGVVRLDGEVTSRREGELVGRIVKGVAGVRALDDRLRLDPGARRSDQEIQRVIDRLFRRDLLLERDAIEVRVDEGRVTLSGTVGSAAEKSRATARAWVQGVVAVDASGLEVAGWARDQALRPPPSGKPDDRVRQALETALGMDPRVRSEQVEVEVDEGRVRLRGVVDDLAARRAAERDAWNTVGVGEVDNRLRVEPTEPVPDDRLRSEVEQALARDPFLGKRVIRVRVHRGQVRLSGLVGSGFERSQAGDVAARVRGVRQVENQLEVRQGGKRVPAGRHVERFLKEAPLESRSVPRLPGRDDRRIRRDILRELTWSTLVDRERLRVEVRDGVATLRGTVRGPLERREAVRNALQGGAVEVIDLLETNQ